MSKSNSINCTEFQTVSDIDGLSVERLGNVGLYISSAHRFGTDAFLLADFAAPRHKHEVADLCSGCGIVAAIMKIRHEPKQLYAVEIEPEGTRLTELTIQNSGLQNFTAICADLKDWQPPRELDVITCNPPYFGADSGFRSRTAATARHELLCTIEDVCAAAKRGLKYGGRLCICNRPERLCDIMCAMRKYGIEPKRVKFVSKNADSAPWLALVEGRRGGKPFLQVEKTLYTTSPDGGFSDELRAVYLD